MFFLTQTALLLMAGIYAIRATYPLFGVVPFSPLTLVAALVFFLVIALFHKLRKTKGKMLYLIVAFCLISMVVNGLLLFAPSAHANPVNVMFSITCVLGWGIVGIAGMMKILRPIQSA